MAESPKYSVIKKQNEIELRQYAGYIQAEVSVVDRNYKSAIESGFNVLAGYIFGNNIARQKIEMTTPVQVSQSQKIAMTTPVKVSQSQKIAMTTPVTVSGDGSYSVAFIMPAEHTLESLPQPKDSAIHFTQLPAHQMAAIRFTGYFNQNTINKNKELLSQWLEQEGLQTEGDFIVAGYNPPWVPGFLAHNEVMIKIKA